MAGIYVILASHQPREEAEGPDRLHPREGHPRLPPGQAHREDGPARLRHHRADPGGRGGARRAAPGRDRPRLLRHPEDPGPRAHRHRRLGGGHRPGGAGGGHGATPSSGCSSASRSPSSRASSTCWPTWPPSWRRPACWSGGRPGCRTRARTPPGNPRWPSYYAARAAMRACNAAVQIHGGYGYTREFPVERYLRDVQAGRDRRGDQRGAEDGHRARAAEGLRVTEAAAGPRLAPARSPPGRSDPRRRLRAAARLMRELDDGDAGAEAALAALYPHTGQAPSWWASPGRPAPASRRWSTRWWPPTGPRASGWGWWRSIRPARSPAGPSWATASACSGTRWTPGCSSARWPPAGELGGLSRAAADVVTVLDAMGFDRVLVETVGVGQDEVDVARLADTVVVVMVPGPGRRGAGASRRGCWRSPTCSWSTRPTARGPIGWPAT